MPTLGASLLVGTPSVYDVGASAARVRKFWGVDADFTNAPMVAGSPLITEAAGDVRYALTAHNHNTAYVSKTGDAMTGALTIQGKSVTASPDAGNALVWNNNGFYVATGSVPISPDAGNIITMRANGLYVPMGLLFGRP